MSTEQTNPQSESLAKVAHQKQFLDVMSRDEAWKQFTQALEQSIGPRRLVKNNQPLATKTDHNKGFSLPHLGVETVPLHQSLDRVLATEIQATINVPSFDRANVDGFAVQAAATFGATEQNPCWIGLNSEVIATGITPEQPVTDTTASSIATGAIIPRGADAVVMVEHTQLLSEENETFKLQINRSVSPGENVTFAGTDLSHGETILRPGCLLTAREIGLIAALGQDHVEVYRRPRVAIISTGNEIIAPGNPARLGEIYDSNLAILTASITELGAEAIPLGIVQDDLLQLETFLQNALQQADVVLLSGGTSKGAGDLSYQVVSQLNDPGIVAHGVALKPGKPICLAATAGKPVVILPGFPTSAIFTFHEFVAPIIRALGKRPLADSETVNACLPFKINSERGRQEFLLVRLVTQENDSAPKPKLTAYPMGKGSGSVSTFSWADGFITIGQQTEILPAESQVTVKLLSSKLKPADLVIIGSHCIGLDFLISKIEQAGWSTKMITVGSQAGLNAVKRGECDLAGIHLFDPETQTYNESFLTPKLKLTPGYRRQQGILYRPGDLRFEKTSIRDALKNAIEDPDCLLINRNPGSGTRLLFDQVLDKNLYQNKETKETQKPTGYAIQVKSHHAVAAAVRDQRADWGMAIQTVADSYQLGFIPVQEEHFDFVTPKTRNQRPAVVAFQKLLTSASIQQQLQKLGFVI